MNNDEKLHYVDTILNNEKVAAILKKLEITERSRMLLYKELNEIVQSNSYSPQVSEYMRKKILNDLGTLWSIQYTDETKHIIKISIPEVPPSIYIKSCESTAYFSELSKRKTDSSIRSLENYPFKFKKVFVWVKFFYPWKFDPDNRYVKPFLDGITRSGIISDDNYSVVKYGFEGILSNKKAYMELYIFGDSSIPNFINNGIY